MPARRPKINRELIAAMGEQFASGAFVDQAAGAVGVHKSTLLDWRRKGEAAREKEALGGTLDEYETLCMELCISYETNRAKACVHAHAAIRAAFSTEWRAAAWYLERTDPENRYGKKFVRSNEPEDPTTGDREAAIAEIESFLAIQVPSEGDVAPKGQNGSNGHHDGNGSNGLGPVEP